MKLLSKICLTTVQWLEFSLRAHYQSGYYVITIFPTQYASKRIGMRKCILHGIIIICCSPEMEEDSVTSVLYPLTSEQPEEPLFIDFKDIDCEGNIASSICSYREILGYFKDKLSGNTL